MRPHHLLVLSSLVACGRLGQVAGAKSEDEAAEILLPEPGTDALPAVDPATCPGGAPAPTAPWTVMVFQAGDNDLERNMVGDMGEMEHGLAAGSAVSVVVQLDRWGTDGAWRYAIDPTGDMDPGTGLHSRLVGHTSDEPDTGDWRTLASFGEWAATCYPAERTMLVVSGHGQGWSELQEATGRDAAHIGKARQHAWEQAEDLRLTALDDTNMSELTVGELSRALEHVAGPTGGLDVFGADACLMQTVEVAYLLREVSSYYLGSEQTEPMDGWPYDRILSALSADPQMSPEDLSRVVVSAYGETYAEGGESTGAGTGMTTMAAVSSADMLAVADMVETLAISLLDFDAELAQPLWDARADSYAFGDGYTDLGAFLVRLRGELEGADLEEERRTEIDSAIAALVGSEDEPGGLLGDAVVATSMGADYAAAWGSSIYFPTEECGYGLRVDQYNKSSFGFDSGWGDVVATALQAGGSDGVRGVRAYGVIELGVNDEQTELVDAWCDYFDGQLQLSSQGEPGVFAAMEVGRLDMEVTQAWYAAGDAEYGAVYSGGVPVNDPEVTLAGMYGSVDLVLDGDGQSLDLYLGFVCDEVVEVCGEE